MSENNENPHVELPEKTLVESPHAAMSAFLESVAEDNIRRAIIDLGRVQDADWAAESLERHRADFLDTRADMLRLAKQNAGSRAHDFTLLWVYVEDLFIGARFPHIPWGNLMELRDSLAASNGEGVRSALEGIHAELGKTAMVRPRQQDYMFALDSYAKANKISLGTEWDILLAQLKDGHLAMDEEPEEMCAWCIATLPERPLAP